MGLRLPSHLHGEDSPSPVKCLSLPTGPSSPFRRSLALCRHTGPLTPLGLLETEPQKALSTPPPPDLPGVWLPSLLPVGFTPTASCDAPSGSRLSGSMTGHSDYLSDPQNLWMGCSPTSPPDAGPKSSAPAPAVTVLPNQPKPRALLQPREAWLPSRKPAGSTLQVDIPLLM